MLVACRCRLVVVTVLVEPRMPTAMQAAMSRANSSVGRVWPACVELDKKSHGVVGIRNAAINRALSKKWGQGTVYVKVLEVSQAQRAKGLATLSAARWRPQGSTRRFACTHSASACLRGKSARSGSRQAQTSW